MARSKLGDNRGAIADYNEDVRINPNYDKAYYNRGNAYSELGDWQDAIVDYNEVVRISPNYAEVYNNRG